LLLSDTKGAIAMKRKISGIKKSVVTELITELSNLPEREKHPMIP
jgi:hypothetical protein